MSGPITPPLTVTTASGTPSGRPITTIKVSDGDLTISGNVATIDTSGGGAAAPADAEYLLAFDASIPAALTAARKLVIGGNISLAHGAGANDDVTIKAIPSETGATVEGQIQFATSDTFDAIEELYYDKPNGALYAGTSITNGDASITILADGTGEPTLNLSNPTAAVSLTCDTNQQLKLEGGLNTFIFDASSATGGITWPDGTTQITAASGGGVTFPLEADDAGGAAAPSYSFDGDTNTGMYRLTGDVLAFSVGGSTAMYMQSGKVEANKDFEFIAGSAASPSAMFASDNDTGLYSKSANHIGFATGGVANVSMGQDGGITEMIIYGQSGNSSQITTDAGTDLFLSTARGTDSGKIQINAGAGGDIEILPSGSGAVEINGAYKLPTAVTGANDYVLTAQTDGSTAWAAAGGGGSAEKVPMITAEWTSADGTMNAFSPAAAFSLDLDIESMDGGVGLYMLPFVAPVAGDVDAFAIRPFASVSAGDEPKAAIYSSNSDGTPNAKLVDCTFGTTAALLVQTALTGSATLVSGTQYWIAFICQDASQNYYTVNIEQGASLSAFPKEDPSSGWNLNQNQYLWIDTGTTSFPATVTNSNFSLQGGIQDFPNLVYRLS